MKEHFTGFLIALTVCSIALNVAQYCGVLNAPALVKLEQTDEQKLASIFKE